MNTTNRLEKVHEIIEQINNQRVLINGRRYDLSELVPEPEPSREVNLFRSLTYVLNNLNADEIDSETDRELSNLRNKFEEKAIEDIISRCEIDQTESGHCFVHSEITDPVSKHTQQISMEMNREMVDSRGMVLWDMARSVLKV